MIFRWMKPCICFIILPLFPSSNGFPWVPRNKKIIGAGAWPPTQQAWNCLLLVQGCLAFQRFKREIQVCCFRNKKQLSKYLWISLMIYIDICYLPTIRFVNLLRGVQPLFNKSPCLHMAECCHLVHLGWHRNAGSAWIWGSELLFRKERMAQ